MTVDLTDNAQRLYWRRSQPWPLLYDMAWPSLVKSKTLFFS